MSHTVPQRHVRPSRRLLGLLLAALAVADCPTGAWGQAVVTSAPPAQVVIVADPYAFRILKHPNLPVLYLTGYGAPGSTNLVTFQLKADGALIPESRKGWPDYLTVNPTNSAYSYYVPRPAIVPEERLLYLVNYQFNPPAYYAETNNNSVAVVRLDEAGLPSRLLKAFRMNYSELGIMTVGWEAATRHLLLSYNTYFGWCQMDKDGLPVSNEFHLLFYLTNFWFYVYDAEWKRLYGCVGNSGVSVSQLAEDGSAVEFLQYAAGGAGAVGNIDVNHRFRKVYLLDGPDNKQIRIFRLTRNGGLTGVPRFFPLAGETALVRFDFRAGLLYAISEKGMLKLYHLDAEGFPAGVPQVSQLPCNGVRDAVVDEATGRIYVACTEGTPPPK